MDKASEQIVDEMSAAQLEKVRLEIESLKSKNKWEDRVARYIPLLTALVATCGFLFGIFQYQSQQRMQQDRDLTERQKDRATQNIDQKMRNQNQIRADVDQLLQFTSNQTQTISRVSFLLTDLNILIEQSANEQEIMDNVFAQNRQTITSTLIRLIHYDCDFMKKPRDVYFTSTVIDHWPDYSTYLRQDNKELNYILYKYIRALRELHQKKPSYFEKIEYDRLAGRYVVWAENENEEQEFQHYGEIVIGFKKHLELIGNQVDLKDRYIEDFQNSLCNPIITEQLFGKNYPSACSRTSVTTSLRGIDTNKSRAKLGVENDLNVTEIGPGMRSERTDNEIRLTPSTQRVFLHILLEDEAISNRYQVSILNSSDHIVWNGYLKPSQNSILIISFPANFLKPGNYRLIVERLASKGNYLLSGVYDFDVVKQ